MRMSAGDRDLILDAAAQSVPFMRAAVGPPRGRIARGRREGRRAGERMSTARPSSSAAAPLLAEYLKEDDLDRLYRQIRALA